MATKKSTESVNLSETFKDFKETKKIDKTTLVSVIEDSFRSVLQKMYGHDDNFNVIVNPEKGDFEIYWNRTVVPDGKVENEAAEISLSDAQKEDPDYEVGEELSQKVNFADFGRRAILNLRQTMAAKILELEHDNLYNKYADKVGQIVNGEVYQIWKREILLLDDEGNELLLPKSEQIPGDFFRKGESTRAVILRVDNLNNNPKIILSRTSPEFLQRLLEQEVPDVGVKGSRIHGIVRELHNENIDVINYTSNIKLFIQRALSPARVSSIQLDEENKKADVYLQPDQVSLAIGKNGLNIKLASMLTGYSIDVFRELNNDDMDNEDIYLDEFKDEIEDWVVEAIKNIGLNTAKSVLDAPREMLIEKADLEEDTVDEVLRILRAEFEE